MMSIAQINISIADKYPAYKHSGVEWLGEIPEHWEVKKLKYSSSIYNGDSLNESKKTKFESDNLDDLAYISSKDIDLDTSNINYENGLRIPQSESKYKVATKESSLICIEGGSAGRKIAFTTQNICFVNKLACIKAKNNINTKFVFHSLKGSLFQTQFKLAMSGMIGGVAISSINNFYILNPPLQEQTAIANFLDDKTAKIDRAIAQKEKMIALLKERKQIIIQDLVTGKKVWNEKQNAWTEPAEVKDSGVEWIGEIPEHWEVKRLKFVSKININSLPENTPNTFSFNYVDIGSVSFENGIERTEYFEFKNAPSRARRIAKKGNTVISTVRTYLKAIDYISEDKAGFIYSTGFAVLEPIGLVNEFLYQFVRSNAFTEQVTVDSKGMSYPAINSTDLSRLFLAIPPIQEQTAIVTHIKTQSAKINKAIKLQEQQIEKLKELKSSLIDGAVTGKIKVG